MQDNGEYFFLIKSGEKLFNVIHREGMVTITLTQDNGSKTPKTVSFDLNYFDASTLKILLDNYLASKN